MQQSNIFTQGAVAALIAVSVPLLALNLLKTSKEMRFQTECAKFNGTSIGSVCIDNTAIITLDLLLTMKGPIHE